jgi:hypothetical protein
LQFIELWLNTLKMKAFVQKGFHALGNIFIKKKAVSLELPLCSVCKNKIETCLLKFIDSLSDSN